MPTSTLIETRDHTWSPVLDGLTAPAMDCIQTGLAALADHAHGPGAHLVLGARLGFPVVPGDPPTLEVPFGQRLAEAEELLGLRVAERRDGLDGPTLRGFADEAGVVYAVADTYSMAWTPYRGQRHMEHSFLLVPRGEDYTVVDPYHNDTQWGPARPGVWRLGAAALDAAIGDGMSAMVITVGGLPEVDPVEVIAGNAQVLTDAEQAIDGYLDQVRWGVEKPAAVDTLVLDIWLLGRSRLFHAAWLRTVPGVPAPLLAELDEQAERWLRLAGQSYLGLRRVARGEPFPPSVLDRLEELLVGDVDLASRLADRMPHTGPVPASVRTTVLDAVRVVLRLDAAAARSATVFRALPNFNSFRLVDIVERVESRLGVVLDAEDLTVDALRDVDSLAGLFAGALRRAER